MYLQAKGILHDDIKTDNILIERLSGSDVRSLLIDFNKACHSDEGQVTNCHIKRRINMQNHPQVAPEVCCGLERQSFASDMYSFGCTRSTAKY